LGAFLFFGTPLIQLYLQGGGNSAEAASTLSYGLDYLKIMLWGLLPFAISNAYSGTLRECNQSTVPMIAGVCAVFVNLILNYVLIFGHFGAPAMGVAGAALATVIGQCTAATVAFIIIFKRSNDVKISFRQMKPNGAMILTIYKVGFPSIIMQALNSFIIMIVNALLMPVSDLSVWILGVYFKVQSFVFMPVFGLNNGMIPIIAYNFGAQKKERIAQLCLLYSSLGAFLMYGAEDR
jgi:putative MATE family efflux protein